MRGARRADFGARSYSSSIERVRSVAAPGWASCGSASSTEPRSTAKWQARCCSRARSEKVATRSGEGRDWSEKCRRLGATSGNEATSEG